LKISTVKKRKVIEVPAFPKILSKKDLRPSFPPLPSGGVFEGKGGGSRGKIKRLVPFS
jgi:hypothetical protein